MTSIEEFNREKCELIPGVKIAAYTDLYLDPDNPTGIILDTTWDKTPLDLTSVVKAAETVTTLYLAPKEGEPEGLCYEKEDGTMDYIHGDDLSRIVSMHLLKDVDQVTAPVKGDVYMYDGDLFYAFNLQHYMDVTDEHLTNIDNTLENLQTQINNLNTRVRNLEDRMTAVENRISAIEGAIYNWANDKTTKIPRGNVNFYGDITNTGSHAHGIFSHDPNTNVVDDNYFS